MMRIWREISSLPSTISMYSQIMRPTLQFQVNCLDIPIIIKSFKFKLNLNTSLLKFQDFLQFSLYITFKGKIDDHIFSLHVILLVLLEIK